MEVEQRFLTNTVQSINRGNDNCLGKDVSDQGRENNKQARQVESVSENEYPEVMLAERNPEEELVVTGESNRQSRESTVSSHSPFDDGSIVNRQLSRHGQELPDSDETESLDERTDNSIERCSSSQSVDIRHEDTSMSSGGRSDDREDASKNQESEENRSDENSYSAISNRAEANREGTLSYVHDSNTETNGDHGGISDDDDAADNNVRSDEHGRMDDAAERRDGMADDIGTTGSIGSLESRSVHRSSSERQHTAVGDDSVHLPLLVLDNIIRTTVRMYPFMLFTFQQVSRFFRNTVWAIGYPAVHLNQSLFPRVPLTVSVRRLMVTFGRNSGVLMYVRHILAGSSQRWMHAWLTLVELDHDWYEIRAVRWR